jgi:hypothetical protein
MMEQLDEEQIRLELKKLVEDLKSKMMQELCDVQSKAPLTQGVTESQLHSLNEKIEQSKGEASLRFQQMIDFIDRR